MAPFRKILFLLIFSLPAAVVAAVSDADLPSGTIWYVHANLSQMRTAESGKLLYNWMDGEVFTEIHDDVGIDIDEEVDAITAFSSTEGNTVILVEGNISQDTQDKLLAIAAAEAKFETREHDDKVYYRVWDSKAGKDSESNIEVENNPLSALEDEAFFSFALKNRLIVTSSDAELREMLDNGGKIAGSGSHENAIFVLTADKTFVQAGLMTDGLADDDDAWKSNVIRHTEQAALLVSGVNDQIAVEAQLVSTDAKMAQSVGGIINGLIGLQAFNSELDPELRQLIENTKVSVEENVLTVSTIIDPELVVTVLDN
jgi:hypothetical protein